MSTSEPWRNNPAPSSRDFRGKNPRSTPNLDEVRYRVPPKSFFPPWLLAWLPAILWSAVIFTLSTDTFSAFHTGSVIESVLRWLIPSLSGDTINQIHFFIRKSAHFTEYFIFFLLLYRGIRAGRACWHWSWGFVAWFIAAVYSCLDEIHQSFVASRTASPWDSLLDSTGALVALVVLFLFYRLFRRTPKMT
jgi:VanZ family protein